MSFACDRVKYLGHWITANGIEVDQEKVSAIQKIPVPTNVKEGSVLCKLAHGLKVSADFPVRKSKTFDKNS
ncbi:hypothetical protein AVEN_79268-1 [Araneus ventricosus]|uniref:Reverse transcriptase domain-containing protein n=1 Tax=Araneus ventricosus TaxID=182803 RepID=A0A4Y2TQA1_ARAVE|nr:hypothetical protein AVEN_79268-1 [Araneus ventricosus]